MWERQRIAGCRRTRSRLFGPDYDLDSRSRRLRLVWIAGPLHSGDAREGTRRMAISTTKANGLELAYEQIGNPSNPRFS
jgi:hypothetical protein